MGSRLAGSLFSCQHLCTPMEPTAAPTSGAPSIKRPLRTGVLIAAVIAFGSILVPNQYRSDARLLPVEGKGGGMGGLGGGLAAAALLLGQGMPGADGGDGSYVDILNSRSLREALLQTEFSFSQRAWRFGAPRARRETLLQYLDTGNIDKGLKALESHLFVVRDPKSRLLIVSAETRSPQLSQLVVQRALQLLESFVKTKGQTRGGAKAAFAESRLAEARREMDSAEADLHHFLNVNRNFQISSDPSIRLKGARLETELKLRQQVVVNLALTREQALLEEKNDMPILNTLDPGNLPIEKSGPSRVVFSIIGWVLGSFFSLAWFNRSWIKARLDEDPSGHGEGASNSLVID